MSEEKQAELHMRAYYYTFDPTGVPEIDLILSAVACAGKAYHHTDQWTDQAGPRQPHTGNTPVEWIQNAADGAATAWNKRADTPSSAEPDIVLHATTVALIDSLKARIDELSNIHVRELSNSEIANIANEVHISMPDDADDQMEMLAIVKAVLEAMREDKP